MPSSQCLFCDHVNPTGANFCNECGSPLHFKRCSHCGTVNDQAAKKCVKCEMEFPALSTGSQARPEASSVLAKNIPAASPADSDPLPFRLDFLNEFPKPAAPFAKEVIAAAETSVASEPSVTTASSPEPQPTWPAAAIELDKLDDTGEARSLDHLPKPAPSATEATVAAETSVAGEPSFATASSPALQLARLAAVKTTEERRSTSRVALTVWLPTIGLIAIGIFAYWVYSNGAHLGEGQGAPAISAAPEPVNSGASPRPIQEIGAKASSAPSASLATGSVGVSETPPAPPIEPSTAVTSSPVDQSAAAAKGPSRADSQTMSPNGQVSRPAASAAESVPSPPSDGRANVQGMPRPRACTEGVAALGLCKGESK